MDNTPPNISESAWREKLNPVEVMEESDCCGDEIRWVSDMSFCTGCGDECNVVEVDGN